jgi:anti-sigma B factor antagonist
MSDADQIEVSTQDGVTVVRLGESFDSLYESELPKLAAILDLADTVTPSLMVIDLSNTKYFGSAFAGFLITVAKHLKERGNGRLCLSNLVPFARMAIEQTKVDQLIGICEDIDQAVSALNS